MYIYIYIYIYLYARRQAERSPTRRRSPSTSSSGVTALRSWSAWWRLSLSPSLPLSFSPSLPLPLSLSLSPFPPLSPSLLPLLNEAVIHFARHYFSKEQTPSRTYEGQDTLELQREYRECRMQAMASGEREGESNATTSSSIGVPPSLSLSPSFPLSVCGQMTPWLYVVDCHRD